MCACECVCESVSVYSACRFLSLSPFLHLPPFVSTGLEDLAGFEGAVDLALCVLMQEGRSADSNAL